MNMDQTIINVTRLNFTKEFLQSPTDTWQVTLNGDADDNYKGTIIKHIKPERVWVLTGERDSVGGGYLGLYQANE